MFNVGDIVAPDYFWASDNDVLWKEGEVFAIGTFGPGSIQYTITDSDINDSYGWRIGTSGWDHASSLKLVHKEFSYDPKQQGDTDDDV